MDEDLIDDWDEADYEVFNQWDEEAKNKRLEELDKQIQQKDVEIERLNNIIKEVRELLKNDYFEDGSFTNYKKVFELLDKGE